MGDYEVNVRIDRQADGCDWSVRYIDTPIASGRSTTVPAALRDARKHAEAKDWMFGRLTALDTSDPDHLAYGADLD